MSSNAKKTKPMGKPDSTNFFARQTGQPGPGIPRQIEAPAQRQPQPLYQRQPQVPNHRPPHAAGAPSVAHHSATAASPHSWAPQSPQEALDRFEQIPDDARSLADTAGMAGVNCSGQQSGIQEAKPPQSKTQRKPAAFPGGGPSAQYSRYAAQVSQATHDQQHNTAATVLPSSREVDDGIDPTQKAFSTPAKAGYYPTKHPSQHRFNQQLDQQRRLTHAPSPDFTSQHHSQDVFSKKTDSAPRARHLQPQPTYQDEIGTGQDHQSRQSRQSRQPSQQQSISRGSHQLSAESRSEIDLRQLSKPQIYDPADLYWKDSDEDNADADEGHVKHERADDRDMQVSTPKKPKVEDPFERVEVFADVAAVLGKKDWNQIWRGLIAEAGQEPSIDLQFGHVADIFNQTRGIISSLKNDLGKTVTGFDELKATSSKIIAQKQVATKQIEAHNVQKRNRLHDLGQ